MHPLAHELDDLRATIATILAEADPRLAAGLMSQLLAMAGRVLERCEDGSGPTGEVFVRAAAGSLAERRPVAATLLYRRLLEDVLSRVS